jgi:hypothetical protein
MLSLGCGQRITVAVTRFLFLCAVGLAFPVTTSAQPPPPPPPLDQPATSGPGQLPDQLPPPPPPLPPGPPALDQPATLPAEPPPPPELLPPPPPPPTTPPPATGQLTIERVWTQDADGNDKTIFIPGDPIRYATLISNTYDQPVKATIRFYAAGPTWVWRDIYNYVENDVMVPVGMAAHYSPSAIPASAQPGGVWHRHKCGVAYE